MKKGDNIRYIKPTTTTCLTYNKIYQIKRVGKNDDISFICDQDTIHTEYFINIKRNFVLVLNINDNVKIL